MRALTLDLGTTSVRAAVVDEQGVVSHVTQRPITVTSPQAGETELNATEIKTLALDCARTTLEQAGACEVLGVTNQRATTIVFDPMTGEAVGPALGWQDLRTVIDCLTLQAEDIRLAPNQSATKARWLLAQSGRSASEVKFATIETWLAWHLTKGREHITDHSNAGVTGLVDLDLAWDSRIVEGLGLDVGMLPRIVDTMGSYGPADALAGAPTLTALIGDQSASLFGQACATRGAKITFGTGAMLDWISDVTAPTTLTRYRSGCFPTVAHSRGGQLTWAMEGIGLSAGSCIEWLRDDLALVPDPASTDALAHSVPDANGVAFVPALAGLGTPQWDFGARGAFFGLTRGANRAHLVRAVLEGIAQTGADLLDAARVESASELQELRVDGGMTANSFMMQWLANVTGLPVAVSSEREATTRGAGLMALVAAGHLELSDVDAMWTPGATYEPQWGDDQRLASREEWRRVVARVEKTIPALSSIEF